MGVRSQRGISLLELLVVLTLTALVSALVLQGLTFMTGVYGRASVRSLEVEKAVLVGDWFRDSASLLVASLDEHHSMQGDGRAFEASTLASIYSEGILARVSWQLREEDGWQVLDYSENGGAVIEITRWQAEAAGFEYLDATRGWVDVWPPPGGEVFELPHRIRFGLQIEGDEWSIQAAVRQRVTPAFDFRDML